MKQLLLYIRRQKKEIEKKFKKVLTAHFADAYYALDAARHHLPSTQRISIDMDEVLAPIKYWNEIYKVLEKVENEVQVELRSKKEEK